MVSLATSPSKGFVMRQGNDPRRRIVSVDAIDKAERTRLAHELVYVGSGLHKSKANDYGFHPPFSPRPSKSVCDGLRSIPLEEARILFLSGIMRGMTSQTQKLGIPDFIWSVDESGQAYEAKRGNGGYHGYPLAEEDFMRTVVIKEWNNRK